MDDPEEDRDMFSSNGSLFSRVQEAPWIGTGGPLDGYWRSLRRVSEAPCTGTESPLDGYSGLILSCVCSEGGLRSGVCDIFDDPAWCRMKGKGSTNGKSAPHRVLSLKHKK